MSAIQLMPMGQEWACSLPFTYFMDFPEELANKVAQGRLKGFENFYDVQLCRKIPLPSAVHIYQQAN